MKNRLLFIILTTVISIVFIGSSLEFLSEKEKGFIYIKPQIRNVEVLNRNLGEYSILNLKKEPLKFEAKDFLDGKIILNVPNGEYILKVDYENNVEYISFEKGDEWKQINIFLDGKVFPKDFKFVLNLITFFLLLLNIFIFMDIKKQLKQDKILYLTFFLLIIKIIVGFRGTLYCDYMKIFELGISLLLGFSIVLYILNNFVKEKYPKAEVIINILISFAIIYYSIIIFHQFLPQVYTYIFTNYEIFLLILKDFFDFINLRRIVLIIIIFNFIVNYKTLKYHYKFYRLSIIFIYIFLESFYIFFPEMVNLSYFIKIIEYIFIYWGVVFISLRTYNKNISRVGRYILGFTLAYISLFYFRTITESLVILFTVILSDFYTNAFEKIMLGKEKLVEKTYNKMCFVQNRNEFEYELEKEIKKNIYIKDVTVKVFTERNEEENYLFIKNIQNEDIFIKKENIKEAQYTLALKLSFNTNPYVGIILLEEYELGLGIEDIKYLENIAEKTSSIASFVRLNAIYKELDLDD